MMRRLTLPILLMVILGAGGCRPSGPAKLPTVAAKHPPTGLYEEVAARAGIQFRFDNGARGRHYILESTGGGCAFFDYDRDGLPDLFLLQGAPFPWERRPSANAYNRLFRNAGGGKFIDVTAGSGLEDAGYTQGVAIGDIDRDGNDDIFVTGYGGNRLFLNEGGTGKFRDVTQQAGLADTEGGLRYDTSAAFGDYDADGDLDLYVCRYLRWSYRTDRPCRNPLGEPAYCTPELYEGDTHALFRNEGDGTFKDVTGPSGIGAASGRGLGVAWLDYNGDGHQDIFVANDLTPFFLWHNNGDGTFTNKGDEAGIAFGDLGTLLSGMGVGVRDYDGDGHEDVFVTNFSGQMYALFRNDGGGLFSNVTLPSGVGAVSLSHLGFGCEFLDFDRDGHPDVLVGNGHVNPDVASYTRNHTYAQPKMLLRNRGDGSFEPVTQNTGTLAVPRVTRGLATADYDRDGHLDVVAINHDAPVELLRYRGPNRGHWIAFETRGTRSNPNGYHARVTIKAGGRTQTAEVRSGSSYLSHSESRLYFGLGKARQVDEVRIEWHGSRTITHARRLKVDQAYRAVEGEPIALAVNGDRARIQ